MFEDKNKADSAQEQQLSQQQAYEFVLEHQDQIVAGLKKSESLYEEPGYLTVEISRDNR